MSNKKKLKTLTKKEINEAMKFQQDEKCWNFYDERAFVETLVSNRFNYLILVYSIFVTAFATIEGVGSKITILALGFIVTTLIGLTIYRAYLKLIINLKILHKLPKNHVFPVINKEVKARCFTLSNVNPIIGVFIPLLFSISFILGIIFVATGVWSF